MEINYAEELQGCLDDIDALKAILVKSPVNRYPRLQGEINAVIESISSYGEVLAWEAARKARRP